MKVLDLLEVVNAVKGNIFKNYKRTITGVSIDSRTINKGDLFIPIRGENHDGHDFIKEAFDKGAAASLCEEESRDKVKDLAEKEFPIVLVKDSKIALLDLAGYYRKQFPVPFIAITGSVGKTTTKELTASILSTKYKVIKNEGNFNNEIGLPLTLFNLEAHHDFGVLEMGMSGLGEIRRMSSIVEPEIAIITNIGVSHIEKLGSKENIAKAKLEVVEFLKDDGVLILNADSPELYAKKGHIPKKVIYFGVEKGEVKGKNPRFLEDGGMEFEIEGIFGNHLFKIPLLGLHNVYNAIAAITAGFIIGLEAERIQEGLSRVSSTKRRLEFKKTNTGKVIIDDCYNASPDSMKAALEVLEKVGTRKTKAAVLGDMLELGDISTDAHLEVGAFVAAKVDKLIAVGERAKNIAEGAIKNGLSREKVYYFNNKKDIEEEKILDLLKDIDIILVKASRAMKFEDIVNMLIRRF
ncbi:UDP-N-acetylmuramoyl-tripeptide--D-alanyl-D-alanine ligase [Thermovenabulum sp.]|uniref:UDP-N-acetylmuramoyl-tripeptide--D-alanyl-D- alanine ligase n=1 Tax=Thermovenabulum sp. TaxID=3100335 RepID=UPI003C7AB2A1